MISKRSLTILIVAMLLVSLLSTGTLFLATEEVPSLSETVTVSVDGKVEKTLTIDGLNIYPGEKRECIVFLKSELTGAYNATLNFEEKENKGLKDFIDVEVYLGDQLVYTGNLVELLSDHTVKFEVALDNELANQLKIVYIMDVSVGDEAQETTVSFYVKLKIGNEF